MLKATRRQRRRARGNIERVAVHTACPEGLVTGEATNRSDVVTSSASWSADVAPAPNSVQLQSRFFADDPGQFPGVDNVACQPDPTEDTQKSV